MTRAWHRTDLRVWLVVSLLLHSFLVALPGSLIEVVFPTRPETAPGVPTDLTPDFREIAFSIVKLQQQQASVPVEFIPADKTDMPTVSMPTRVSGDGTGHAAAGGHGDSGAPADTCFFPPVPRLIVPPDLADLGITTLDINIRILVGTDGYAVEIELPDTLSNDEIRRRLLDSAARFRFEPAHEGARRVPAWISLPLELKASAVR